MRLLMPRVLVNGADVVTQLVICVGVGVVYTSSVNLYSGMVLESISCSPNYI